MQFLDAETRRALDFDAIWSRLSPASVLGRAKQRQVEPFLPEQVAELEDALERLNKVVACLRERPLAANNLVFFLRNLRDISPIIERSRQGEVLDDADLFEVKRLLWTAHEIQDELERLDWTFLLSEPLECCPEFREELSVGQGQQTSFYVADAYDPQLAEVRRRRKAIEGKLTQWRAEVNARVIQAAGRGLSMENEITISRTEPELVSSIAAIEELVPIEETDRLTTFRLREDIQIAELRRELALLRSEEEACKLRVRRRLSELVGIYAPTLLRILENLGNLDFLLAKAKLGVELGGVKPELCSEPRLSVVGGCHPEVENQVQTGGSTYIPLTLELRTGVTVITGPNMGGKTATLKTLGLLTAMAQFGLLVPAVSFTFQPRRFIRAHLASGRVVQGLSTFAEEMAFVREALTNSSAGGLLLLDELAHGTNPLEGAAVAQAVVERLRREPTMTVVTTHFPALAKVQGVAHYRIRGIDQERLTREPHLLSTRGLAALQELMDYTLEPTEPGKPAPSDAVLVAEAMGLEPEIIARAKVLQGSDSHG